MLLATAINARFMMRTHGFPLDDAYIYYQYVKNLSRGMGLSFNPGEVSFGVTSFLYTLLSAITYNLLPGVDEIYSMQIVGILSHAALIYFAQRLVFSETNNLTLSCFTGFALAVCRPLYFTASAGLETLLFHAIAIAWAYAALRKTKTHPLLLGLLAGALFLTRPEGLAVAVGYLFFLAFYAAVLARRAAAPCKPLALEAGFFLFGVLIMALPYTLYIHQHSGLWLPTTFYGKLISHNDFTTWSLLARIREGFISLAQGYQSIIQQDASTIAYCLLFAMSLASLLAFAYQCGRKAPNGFRFAAHATLFSLFLFPMLFGSAFHIRAQFGGYAARYIQIIIVLMHIETAFALHWIIQWATGWAKTRQAYWRNSAALLLALPMLYVIASRANFQLKSDLDFYQFHSEKRQGVRKQAAEWIRLNTPPSSRILLGSTGLGVIGAYCDRYCKDEGGLLHPDIYPYLKGFSDQSPHWAHMLEYMKKYGVNYYTTYAKQTYHNPISHPTRHTTLAVRVTDPELEENEEYSWFSEIRVYRFKPQEYYELWNDAPQWISVLDRDDPPHTDGRLIKTTWNDYPVIGLAAGPRYFEASYEQLMPNAAAFKAQLAVQVPERDYASDDWVRFNVYVDIQQERDVVYSETFNLKELSNNQPFRAIELDLSKYNNRFAKLVLATAVSPMIQPGPYWAGWVRPQLYNAEQGLSE